MSQHSNQITGIVLAGGKSERMKASMGNDIIPKPMVKVNKYLTLLEHQIDSMDCIVNSDISHIVSVSHDANKIQIDPYYRQRGWSIEKVIDSQGSGETLAKAIEQRQIKGPILCQQVDMVIERQVKLYYDLMWAFDKIQGEGSIIVVDNRKDDKKSATYVTTKYGDNKVQYLHQYNSYLEDNDLIDCGIHLFSEKAVRLIPEIAKIPKNRELYNIINTLILTQPVYAYNLWPHEWVNVNTKDDIDKAQKIILPQSY